MAKSDPIVFVVDDDEAVRLSTEMLIRSMGLRVESFESAAEFLQDFDPQQPGCVILDIRMPGMSGLELQEHLNEIGATIPVIFVTGHGDVPMAVTAMKAGAVDFIQKPFRDQELIDRVHAALERDSEEREESLVRAATQESVDLSYHARARGHGARSRRAGEQGDRLRSRAEPANRRDPPRPRHVEDGRRVPP
jgi:FixJ family two-component response regulator